MNPNTIHNQDTATRAESVDRRYYPADIPPCGESELESPEPTLYDSNETDHAHTAHEQ